VVAFPPQNSAAAFSMDNLVLMDETWLRDFMPANVQVHDGYTVDVPKELADAAAEELIRILTRPIPEMGGLRVGCEVEVGNNWKDMESIAKIEIEGGVAV
jgi:hypothetical protein